MKEFWDTRFSNEEYIYGTTPNKFFEKTLNDLNLSGNILFPAEGEGRNAVFAAKNGLNVTAFDLSVEGKNKALKLAKENNIEVNYLVGNLEELDLKENYFDAIVLVFAHFHPNIRPNFHTIFSSLLKKDGVLILEGFSKNNLAMNNSNGPKNLDLLFTTEIISNDFPDLKVMELSEKIVDIEEGNLHKGKSSVIRFVGKKL